MKIYISVIIAILCCNFSLANAQNFKKVDAWLDEHTTEMGGRSILMVYQNGHIVYSHAVNQLNARQRAIGNFVAKRQGKPANLSDYTPALQQPIASCSKWLSAALIMTFVDEGKLKLTDTVGKYLPVLSQNGKGKITISECLSHLTAIKAPPIKESLSEMKNINSMDESIDMIAKLPMEGEPGKVFHYSSDGLQIVGAILEKISNKSFETLFAEKIARPLNMQNTDFGKSKVAHPAGGANSTPKDYLNFLTLILNRGTYNGKRVISENSVKLMQVNRLTPDVKIAYSPAEAGNFGYGYGEWVMENATPNKFDGTVTSPGLFGSFPWVNNGKKYAAFLMTFYIKSDGRNERYKELKKIVDEAVN